MKRMSVSPTERKRRKEKAKQIYSAVKTTAELIVLSAAFLFGLNDEFFKIEQIPSSYDVVRFFGAGARPYVKLSDGEASVSFIDVGQGDCELITTEKYNILIDCGEEDMTDAVLGFLKYSGVKRLDLVIVTHPHGDHYGGMYKILREFDAGLFIMPELPEELVPRTVSYKKLLTVIDKKRIPARYACAGERFVLGENAYLDIIAPVYYDYKEMNDFSIAARFVHGNNSFLFTGDLERFGELDLADSGAYLDSDVLKVGHHGSAGSSSGEFLAAVTPKIAVFEVAEINFYKHPRSAVLNRLGAAGCEAAYSTANNGNVVIISDGEHLRIEVEKGYEFNFGN